jgi:hypothetical protein
MSQTTTLVLLPQTAYNFTATSPYNVTGNAVAGASYYLSCKCLQTFNVNTTNFTGNLSIQASLATTPGNTYSSTDWFELYRVEADYSALAGTPQQIASNTNVGVNINGNYVWLRATIENLAAGTVNWVKVSY